MGIVQGMSKLFGPSLAKRMRLLSAGLMCATLVACSATFVNHGYIPPEEDLAFITPGIDSRSSLEDSIGLPSASGVIRDDTWFYIASRVRNYAYRAPEVIERQIVAISFDTEGTVTNVEQFGLEDGQLITLSRRVTDTNIQDITFLRQLMRNFGRIDVGQALAN